jgi:hypothetical protein
MKIRTGSWINPAPPPEKAENRFATRDTRNRTSCSTPFTAAPPLGILGSQETLTGLEYTYEIRMAATHE